MFGFDIFPAAAASLDMTADFAPLLSSLGGLLGLSVVGIAASAISSWILNSRRPAVNPTVTAPSDFAPEEQTKAA